MAVRLNVTRPIIPVESKVLIIKNFELKPRTLIIGDCFNKMFLNNLIILYKSFINCLIDTIKKKFKW